MTSEQQQAIVELVAAASAVTGANEVLCKYFASGENKTHNEKLCSNVNKAIQSVKETCFDGNHVKDG